MCNGSIKGLLDILRLVSKKEELTAIKDGVFDNIVTSKMNLLPTGSFRQNVSNQTVNDYIGAPKRWSKAMFNML